MQAGAPDDVLADRPEPGELNQQQDNQGFVDGAINTVFGEQETQTRGQETIAKQPGFSGGTV